VTRVRIQPFIVTLCGLLFYRGVARFIAGDETKGFGSAGGFESLQRLATGSLFHVPMPFVLMIVIGAVMWVVLHRSVYGRYLFAVGRNEEAARYSGINSRRIIARPMCFRAMAGIAGSCWGSALSLISPSSHGSFTNCMASRSRSWVVASPSGGEGSIIGI
jgi:ribose transport system permease protein